MIAAVRGEVLEIGLDHAVVEVGGVGLAVHATPATLARLRRGEQGRMATSLVVREDSLTLFGFADAEERELFVHLLTVSGVGPKVALVWSPDSTRPAWSAGHVFVARADGRGSPRRLTEGEDPDWR